MDGRQKLKETLEHRDCGKVTFDLGGTKATGISASLLYRLRKQYGRDEPVKIYDTYQMVGLVDDKDAEMFGIDVLPLWSDMTVFGYRNDKWKTWTTPDGTPALIGEGCVMSEKGGRLYIHPKGDLNARPSGCMPQGGFYFDYLTRQDAFDEERLSGYEDYLEQLEVMTIDDTTLKFYEDQADYYYSHTGCGLVLNAEYGNLGSQTMLNGGYAKLTPGIRDFSEFLVAHSLYPKYIEEIFEAWTKLCIRNLKLLRQAVGDKAQAVFLCGTDFGTQHSEIMSKKMFQKLYMPYFKRINGWVHENTSWKTVYHSCGSLVNILEDMIDCGIDCLNPIQLSADHMDPQSLKAQYGRRLTFWGGGVDSQTTMAHGTPEDVEREMRKNIDILRKDGGFVFSVVHNLQNNFAMENVQRVFDVLREYR
ncbi:uroporphyrinogen decarboxylase family protein [Lactonifactor longoviformis]|uniref:Uroporphyrinogen decarboxylase (URO-D) n=1 Tax=Lactonifactor longoviformis DSM 17459 TaxID=1122155 RepID=A0A1M4UW05_9CLOT|nr:uroporphyrinogen decarboxylase family protein [Lactonifactor longoviformis]SHE60839.1 Uroporphyrinogen decarboxylase (URO-D) [Lactonifactor longoviformis DSM 17459]